jgi:hypothetical protein
VSLRDSLLALVEKLQEIPGPTGCDIRPTRVYVVKSSWSGGEVYTGVETETILCEILPRPRVNETVDGRELVIEPIIPKHPKGGLDFDVLNPDPDLNEFIFIRTVGANSGNWVVSDLKASRPFRYIMTVRTLNRDYPRPNAAIGP